MRDNYSLYDCRQCSYPTRATARETGQEEKQKQQQRAHHIAALSFPSALPKETLKNILAQAQQQSDTCMAFTALRECFLDAVEDHLAQLEQASSNTEQKAVASTVSVLIKNNANPWFLLHHEPKTPCESAMRPLVVQYRYLAEKLAKSQKSSSAKKPLASRH